MLHYAFYSVFSRTLSTFSSCIRVSPPACVSSCLSLLLSIYVLIFSAGACLAAGAAVARSTNSVLHMPSLSIVTVSIRPGRQAPGGGCGHRRLVEVHVLANLNLPWRTGDWSIVITFLRALCCCHLLFCVLPHSQ